MALYRTLSHPQEKVQLTELRFVMINWTIWSLTPLFERDGQ